MRYSATYTSMSEDGDTQSRGYLYNEPDKLKLAAETKSLK